MPRSILLAVLAVAALTTAGCGTTYTKAGATPAQVAADKKQCTRLQTWTRWGRESRRYVETVRGVDADCMRKLGYQVSGGV